MLYDAGLTIDNTNRTYDLTIKGFYQPQTTAAEITYVVGSGQDNKRRAGLTMGYALATLAIGVSTYAILARQFPLFVVSLFLFGAGFGSNRLARYVAADLYPPERRATMIGWIVWASTIGAVGGTPSSRRVWSRDAGGAAARASGCSQPAGTATLSSASPSAASATSGGASATSRTSAPATATPSATGKATMRAPSACNRRTVPSSRGSRPATSTDAGGNRLAIRPIADGQISGWSVEPSS